MSIMKTKNYKQFKFLESNRPIIQHHLEQLVKDIQENNLLFADPIKVNENMEVIDGQHRLTAAKQLGVDIYYTIEKDLKVTDMITLNKNKKVWSNADYMHHYCSEQYPEYIKLKRFMESNGLSLNLAITLCDQWRSSKAQVRFKDGEFVFNERFNDDLINKAKDLVGMIKMNLGFRPFMNSGSLFKALCIMLSTENVDFEHFKTRIEMHLPKIHACTNIRDYLEMFVDIYNYRMSKHRLSVDELDI